MGATTTISVFHHDRFRSCVVPAVRRLLRSGELGPWLQAVWDHRQSRYSATAGRPFVADVNGPDEVRFDEELTERGYQSSEWFHLPAHGTRERDMLSDLFRHAVEGCCLGESASVGNHTWPRSPWDEFVPPELSHLLWQLGGGMFVWSTFRGTALEGVRGWLDADQTAELARGLHRIELAERPPELSLFGVNHAAYFRQRAESSLFQIRGIADRAWGVGQGVLCGSELELDREEAARFNNSHPTYTTETVQLLARAIRDRREFDVLPVLADALQEAGCENEVVLAHCRDVNEHTDACWVADLILASEVSPA